MNNPGIILVTGAAGRLGSVVVARLQEAGLRVRATDVRPSLETGIGEWHTGNLAQREMAIALMQDVTHVAHLGNHASNFSRPGEPQTIFNENVAANLNVFQAAQDAGVERVVFSSSIQSMVSEGANGIVDGAGLARPLLLPLNGTEPSLPGNTYGLSKQVGETALAYYCRNHDLSACALRLPHLFLDAPQQREKCGQVLPIHVAHAFAWLANVDAARLIVAALFTALPGYRVYLPASSVPCSGDSVVETVARYYADVPWRDGVTRSRLVDITSLQRDFGWSPEEWSPFSVTSGTN